MALTLFGKAILYNAPYDIIGVICLHDTHGIITGYFRSFVRENVNKRREKMLKDVQKRRRDVRLMRSVSID
jgi:hypothetical protein